MSQQPSTLARPGQLENETFPKEHIVPLLESLQIPSLLIFRDQIPAPPPSPLSVHGLQTSLLWTLGVSRRH